MQLPVVGRSNIIDAANMLSRHNRAVKVDPNYMVIRITGEHASFSVPGTRAESVTYDVPTFAALKGAIDNAIGIRELRQYLLSYMYITKSSKDG